MTDAEAIDLMNRLHVGDRRSTFAQALFPYDPTKYRSRDEWARAVTSERGNGTARQVVEVIGMPECITFQAHHPNADSSYTHPSPWQHPLQKITMATLSPDSARHLVSALVGFGFHEPVELELKTDHIAFRTRMVKMSVY